MPKLARTLLSAQIHAALTIAAAGGSTAKIPGRLEVRAAASDGGPAELIVYGDIGDSWYDESVAAADVVRALAGIDAAAINVRINSYGGSVTDGLAIYNALKRHPARIDVTIDGIAASIASLIAMAGDTVSMPSNALLMIHAPWGGVYGNAAELREYAAVLDVYSKAMATNYAAKTGHPYADMLALVSDGADHYFTAADAHAAGFCDAVIDDADATEAAAAGLARVAAQAGFARYTDHAPAAIAAALRPTPAPAPAAVVPDSPAANAGATQTDAPAPVAPQEPTMPNPNETPTAAEVTAATNATAIVLAAQRDRNVAIIAAARPHADNAAMATLRDEALADPDMTLAAFNARALAILGTAVAPAAGAFTPGGGDESDKRRSAMEQSIEARAGVGPKPDGANPFRGMALRDLARECARAAGVNVVGLDPLATVKAAISHGTSDFPLLLGNVVQRQVMAGYEEHVEVFPMFTKPISVTDFRPTSLAALGHFTGIRKVLENGEYKFGTFDEFGSSVTLAKYGAKFGISHEAIVNDDLAVFSSVPQKMGGAAKSDLGDRVFALLTGNPNLADGVALFHADHGNLVAPGGAITTATVDGVRVLMATQKTPGGKTIRVRLKYLVVPVGKGGTARTVLNSEFEVGTTTRNNTTPNHVRNTFEVLEDPRLDDANPNAWYGIADPNSAAGIVIAYRDGVQEPTVEQKAGWDIDGVEFKVRLEAEPAIGDHRALAKNPGE